MFAPSLPSQVSHVVLRVKKKKSRTLASAITEMTSQERVAPGIILRVFLSIELTPIVFASVFVQLVILLHKEFKKEFGYLDLVITARNIHAIFVFKFYRQF
jgi:hypothetical protein